MNHRIITNFASWIFCAIAVLIFLPLDVVCAKAPADMVLVPEGKFIMGSKIGDKDEEPVHEVYLDAFYIDKYEVSNSQYNKFVKAAKARKSYCADNPMFNKPNQPVVCISWDDAASYCKWVKKRLPTEAEWEKAARGTDGRLFAWGQKWISANANSNASDLAKPAPVGSYPKGVSPYGAYDMSGNVWEWCADWYSENYYHLSPQRNPKGQSLGDSRVIRGGGWFDLPAQVTVTNRYDSHPLVRYNGIGFRCARDSK